MMLSCCTRSTKTQAAWHGQQLNEPRLRISAVSSPRFFSYIESQWYCLVQLLVDELMRHAQPATFFEDRLTPVGGLGGSVQATICECQQNAQQGYGEQ
jgi:hypothetical protein